MIASQLPFLILMAGHAGTGKTTFSRLFLARQIQAPRQRSWAFLDKDTIGGMFTNALMHLHTNDGFDRDSVVFSEKVRPLEYKALHDVVFDNLCMGTSCIACAPFGQECISEDTFEDHTKIYRGLANVLLVWSHVTLEEAKIRIEQRAHPMDKHKLVHWEEHARRRYDPAWIRNHKSAYRLQSGTNEGEALAWLQERVN